MSLKQVRSGVSEVEWQRLSRVRRSSSDGDRHERSTGKERGTVAPSAGGTQALHFRAPEYDE